MHTAQTLCVLLSLGAGPAFASPIPNDQASHRPAPGLISLRIQGSTLRDSLAAFEHISGLRLRPLWADPDHLEGLDPEMPITLNITAQPPFKALELILIAADRTATWQHADDGSIEVGPRSRLNARQRIEVYAVRDLVNAIPDFPEAATIDLQAALSARGGDQSPIREQETDTWTPAHDRKERMDELVLLLTTLVEPEQWVINGGNGGSIQVHGDVLVVKAPGYIHRQLAGR